MKQTTFTSFLMLSLITVLISLFSTSFITQNSKLKKVNLVGGNSDSVLQQKIDSIELSVLQLAKLDNMISQYETILDSISKQKDLHQNLKITVDNEIAGLYQSLLSVDSSNAKVEGKSKMQGLKSAVKRIGDKQKVENEIKILSKLLKSTDSIKNIRSYDSINKLISGKTISLNKMEKEVWTIIGKVMNRHPDSVSGNPLIQSLTSKLLIKEEDILQITDVITTLEKRKKDIEKQNTSTAAEYKRISSVTEPEFAKIRNYLSSDSGNNLLNLKFNGSSFRCFLVSSNIHYVQIHNNTTKFLKPLDYTWKQLKKEKFSPLAVMNGGMYNEDGTPVGVFIKGGKILNPLETSELPISDNFHLYPNGVFYIDTLGRYFIKKTSDFKKYISKDLQSVAFATQSGPMLLISGQPNKAFSIDSKNINIRNGVGILESSKNTRMVMIISDTKVNFYNFSMLFKYIFGCKDALYMDGAISKMYVKFGKVESGDLGGQLGPVISVSKK